MKSKTTRLAAASVLAITIPFAPTAAHSATTPAPTGLTHAKSFVHYLDRGVQHAPSVNGLTQNQRTSVLNAVDSAIAASAEAVAAIETARTASLYTADQAREDLQDAITALQAAAAEATYVLDTIPEPGIAHQLLAGIRDDIRGLLDRLV